MNAYQSEVVNEYGFWDKYYKSGESLPDIDREVLPGVKWGCSSTLFTPAYWKMQYLLLNQNENKSVTYKLGDNILEEVVVCLLGGFGMKSEIGLAAFDRLKTRNLIAKGVNYEVINDSLKEAFLIKNKKIHYRFPNQKAKFISDFLNRSDLQKIPLHNDLALRNWLMSVKGIGPKTASWITRNILDSENVAIIDIHIYRAGLITGLFSSNLDMQKDYFKMESLFIKFCRAMQVQPSKMDTIIWLQMKASNRLAIKAVMNI